MNRRIPQLVALSILALAPLVVQAQPFAAPPLPEDPFAAEAGPPDRSDLGPFWLTDLPEAPVSEAAPKAQPIYAEADGFAGRGCRGDLIAISVPTGRSTHELGAPMADIVEAVVAEFNDPGGPWRAVAQAPFQAVAEPVFADSDRHWLMAFVGHGGERVRIRAELSCEVVAGIRQIADRYAPDQLSIGRECDAMAQGGWHVEAMTPAGPMYGGPGLPIAQSSTVALIDGPLSDVGARWSRTALETGAAARVTHPHAAAMAHLIREMAPTADIRHYRALDDGRNGTPTAAVARALKRALSDRPDIVNLSLGWPSEMGRPTELRGPGCETIEDPAGEAVREMLVQATQQGVAVVAAAGNRRGANPLDPDGRLHDPLGGGVDYGILKPYRDIAHRVFPCAPDAGFEVEGEQFFPAAWSRLPTCVGGAPETLPIIAVGAYGATGEPLLGDADLYAPGTAVPLTPVPSALSARLPGRITGTSAAAAITSGHLARSIAEGRLQIGGLQPVTEACGPDGEPFVRLRACSAIVLPEIGFRPVATRIDAQAGGEPLPITGLVLDQHGAAGLGPQPEHDPCDDDCRFIARRGGTSGRLELRMRFGQHPHRRTLKNVSVEIRRGKSVSTVPLGKDVIALMNGQLNAGVKGAYGGTVKLDVTDVAGTLTDRTSVELVYTVSEVGLQSARRRSKVVPAYAPPGPFGGAGPTMGALPWIP